MYKEQRNWYIKETLQYVWTFNYSLDIASKFLENTLPNIEVIENDQKLIVSNLFDYNFLRNL